MRTLLKRLIYKILLCALTVERGLAGQVEGADQVKKEFSADEKKACSIEAMMNGEECEACQ